MSDVKEVAEFQLSYHHSPKNQAATNVIIVSVQQFFPFFLLSVSVFFSLILIISAHIYIRFQSGLTVLSSPSASTHFGLSSPAPLPFHTSILLPLCVHVLMEQLQLLLLNLM